MNGLGRWLYQLSRRWEWTRRWFGIAFSVDPSSLNRPCVWGDWYRDDDGTTLAFACLSWGNGNSDPLWAVDLTIRLPRWAARRRNHAS